MSFALRMGQPEMEALWQDLSTRKQAGRLGQDEEKFFKKLVKVLGYLSADPRHNSLSSHEISGLSRKHGLKIFQPRNGVESLWLRAGVRRRRTETGLLMTN
jgi:hypothetical protein